MKPNYSKAPWQAIISDWPAAMEIVDAKDNHIATVNWYAGQREITLERASEGYANVRLIVQAPALHDLLTEILSRGQLTEAHINRGNAILNKVKNWQ